MTVIACDGQSIAADSLAINGGAKTRVSKLFSYPGVVVGVSGFAGSMKLMADWVAGGCKTEDRPAFQAKEDEGCRALALRADGTIWMAEQHGMFEVLSTHAAIGSGQDFALAAMHLGQSAEDSCYVACHLSSSCGKPVQVIYLRDIEAAAG